jgi:hypothetical protein
MEIIDSKKEVDAFVSIKLWMAERFLEVASHYKDNSHDGLAARCGCVISA